jgi:hypothetical protein
MVWSRRATGSDPNFTPTGGPGMLILTGIVSVLALIYLGYAMIRPESF